MPSNGAESEAYEKAREEHYGGELCDGDKLRRAYILPRAGLLACTACGAVCVDIEGTAERACPVCGARMWARFFTM